MKATKTKPTRINIRISKRAYKALSSLAKKEGRTILATVDNLLSA